MVLIAAWNQTRHGFLEHPKQTSVHGQLNPTIATSCYFQ